MGNNRNTWRPEEDEVLFDNYEEHGAAGCLPHLAGRTRQSVTQRAFRLGLKTQVNPAVAVVSVWQRGEDTRDSALQTKLDAALTNFREAMPAANLCWSLGRKCA
jgi:hypothetical protein